MIELLRSSQIDDFLNTYKNDLLRVVFALLTEEFTDCMCKKTK